MDHGRQQGRYARVHAHSLLARVQGLGASGHGVEHWWLQRVTAVSNIPLIIAFVIIVAALAGSSYAEAIELISHPLVAIVLILAIISVTNHMRLGMQVDHRGLRARQGPAHRSHHRE